MLVHIVKNNENIDDIINTYNVTLADLKKSNNHITDFNNLVGGTKLRIPMISEEIEQILETTESFISDYYSKISDEILNDFEQRNKVLSENTKKEIEVNNIETKEDISRKTIINSDNRIAYPGIVPPKKPYNGRNH
ncbi:MAG: LysM peptidoglycan-binding domain-containing protein [Anaeroplasma sp.]